MSVYEQLKPSMDAQVDASLGDSITYTVGNVTATIPGFLTLLNDPGGFDGMQPLQTRWTCKIHRQYLPTGPSRRHRITSPKLEGPYSPAADTIAEDGAYFLFDIQKAAA